MPFKSLPMYLSVYVYITIDGIYNVLVNHFPTKHAATLGPPTYRNYTGLTNTGNFIVSISVSSIASRAIKSIISKHRPFLV